MENFFNAIYSLLCDSSLGIYKIMESILDEYGDGTLLSSYLPLVGTTTIFVSLIIAFAFYIWPINHPRFKAWWAWLVMLFTNLIINFGMAFAFISWRISSIERSDDLNNIVLEIIKKDELTFTFYEQLQFAMSNVWFGAICFVVACLILNWFSTNCKFSPFRK